MAGQLRDGVAGGAGMRRSPAFEQAKAAVVALLEQLDSEGHTGTVYLDFHQGVAQTWGKAPARAPLRRRIDSDTTTHSHA